MQVENLTELEDGRVTLNLDMSWEEMELLLNYAVNEALKAYIDEQEDESHN